MCSTQLQSNSSTPLDYVRNSSCVDSRLREPRMRSPIVSKKPLTTEASFSRERLFEHATSSTASSARSPALQTLPYHFRRFPSWIFRRFVLRQIFDSSTPISSFLATPSSLDAPARPFSRDRLSAASTPSSEASQPGSAVAVDSTPKSPVVERPPSNSGAVVPAKESDPDKMQKVFSVLSAVFAAKLGIVLPTPGSSTEASTVAAPEVVEADEPVETAAQVEPMEEDESEMAASTHTPIADSQTVEALPSSADDINEETPISSDVLMTDDQPEDEITSEPLAEEPPVVQPPVEQPPVEQPSLEQPPVEQSPVELAAVEQPPTEQPAADPLPTTDDLMKDPRALLDRASAVLQQMHQRKQIKVELEEPAILYEQLEPDPDCEAIEEEKPLPHFHGEPVPEDMEDEEGAGVEAYEPTQPGKPRKRNLLRARRTVEEEPQLDEAEVQLDYYSSDLHLKPAQDNRYQVDPENKDGFALMWGGIKASYGVRSGKVAYQVKIIEFLSMNHLPFEEIDPHDLRVGWSETNAPYQLGEAAHSYAFCSVGRKAVNNIFSEYGQPFHQDDVITCCLDLTKREISYYKNGESLGVAFSDIPLRVRHSTDEESVAPSQPEEDMVFLPHVATKNCKFEVNFGQQGVWGSLPEGFRFMNDLGVDERVRGPVGPANKSDCTVLMMVGLPGVGKTTWVRQYLREHVEERWSVLNAETIMAAMKVNGVARRRIHQGRWDMIMGLTAKALTRSLHLACRRRKNYIIDQTNVAKDTRRKKLGQFREFQRKCVVIIPDDDEFINRQFRQAKSDGTGPMPVEAMLELKAVFSIPNVNTEPIEDVHFVEPPAARLHEAFELVNKYNQEARPWYQKRYRGRPPIALNDSHSGGGGNRRFDSRRPQHQQQHQHQHSPAEQFSPVDMAPTTMQGGPRNSGNSDSRPRRIVHEEPEEHHSSGEEEQANPGRQTTGAPASAWAPTQITAGWDRPAGWVNRPNEGYAGFGDSMPQSLVPPPPKEKQPEPPPTASLWAERKQQANAEDAPTAPPDPAAASSS
uniref:B30.2/SPRY domain-containing protein n=1 Tax=Plectus sambesii TaxID=2011161 RepID=A0A914W198_9BILA